MHAFIQTLAGAIAGATSVGGALFLILRHALERKIDHHFDRLEDVIKERLSIQGEIAREQIQKEMATYPAIGEIIYRAKLAADKVRLAKTTPEVLNADVFSATRALTEQLQFVRIYLPPELFNDLHHYKHLLQDVLVIGDILTRPDKSNSVRELSLQEKRRIQELCRDISELCDVIVGKLQQRILALQGPLAPGAR